MMSKSLTITDPTLPGEVLLEEFLIPLGLSASAFAHRLGVPPNRITRIINGQTAITPETAMLFAKAFGTTPDFWVNLQVTHDLIVARRSPAIQARVDAIEPIAA